MKVTTFCEFDGDINADDDDDAASMHKQQHALLPSQPVCRLVGHDNSVPITLVRYTSEGKYCVTAGHDKKIILWNPLRLDPAFHTNTAKTAVSTVTGKNDGDIAIEQLPRALPIQTYDDGIRYTPTALQINHDTTRLLIGSNKTAVLIDCVTKQVLRQFHGHTAVINSVAMYMSGNVDQVYATASYDATVCLWDARSSNTYRPIQILKDAKDSVTVVDILSSSTTSNDIDTDATMIRTASVDGNVRTYDIRRGMMQCDNYESPVISIAKKCTSDRSFSSTCNFAASCLDGSIRVTSDSDWSRSVFSTGARNSTNASTVSIKPSTICRDRHVAGQYALECCFLVNGRSIVTGSENGNVVLYNIQGEKNTDHLKRRNVTKQQQLHVEQESPMIHLATKQRECVGHLGPTCSVVAHPNRNDVIISAGYDGNCIVWANTTHQNYFHQL